MLLLGEIIILSLQVFLIVFIVLFICHIFITFLLPVPFVPLRKSHLKIIDEELFANTSSQHSVTLFDLGSGDGRVVRYLSQRHKGHFIGIEKNFLLYLFSRLVTRKQSSISYRYESFFDTNLRGATHIVMYLFPEIVTQMWQKLEKECPGAICASYDFKVKNQTPFKVVTFNEKNLLGKKLYLYKVKNSA